MLEPKSKREYCLCLQPMPMIEQNGPDFKYIIAYRRTDDPTVTGDTIAVVQDPTAWHYVVPDTNLGIYRPFRITVKANNARGDSSANLGAVIGYTGESGKHFMVKIH